MARKLGVIFDLDGTLIDSAPDLAASLNRVLAARSLPSLTLEQVRGMIGDGAKALVERGFAARGSQAGVPELEDFLADYEAHPVVETRPYPGIVPALNQLAGDGHEMAVCTNKPATAAHGILERLGLRAFFTGVVGGDSTLWRKPDPRHLAAAVAVLGGPPCVMVGDHPNDMAAARGLQVSAIFVAWGYGTAEGTARAETPAALPGLIAAL